MPRLRQQNPQNYASSANISVEFENLIRYINAAELGDKTIGELMEVLFNEDGEFEGPISMRLDPINGLQFRVGTYENPEAGWQTLTSVADIRGPSGQNVGVFEGPFFYNRQDYVAAQDQAVFNYIFDSQTDDVLVYVNGALQSTANYTANGLTNTITFTGTQIDEDDIVVIYSVRIQQVSNYRRVDLLASTAQSVFAFPHEEFERILVFRNGLIQREGGAYDYTASSITDTITFTSALTENELVTIITVENNAIRNFGGLMVEDEYTDENGFIKYDKLAIEDDEIPQAKVSGLAPLLSSKAKITLAATPPVSPSATDIWIDSSTNPNRMRFFDGVQWILTSPDSTLPAFTGADALKYVRVNSSGTALEYGNIDFTTLVPKTYMGAANGVATLDSSGKMPVEQMPQTYSAETISYFNSGSVTNATVFVKRIYRQKIRIDGIAYKLAAGTCTLQISVDGTPVGGTFACTSTLAQSALGTVIEVDASVTSRRLEILITSASGASGLELAYSVTTVTI